MNPTQAGEAVKMKVFTGAPLGVGTPPPNKVDGVWRDQDESVIWHKDAAGWPIGFQIVKTFPLSGGVKP